MAKMAEHRVEDTAPLLSDEGTDIQASVADRKCAVWPQFVAVIIVSIGALSGGYTIGYSSPTTPEMQNFSPPILNEQQASWYSSIITLGAASGGPIAGILADRLGRKATIMTSTLPSVFGWLILAWSDNYLWLYVARFLTGISLGMACMSIPTYIAEVSTKEYRGLLGSGFQLSITIGVLVVYLLGMPLSWKWLAIGGAFTSALLAVCMLVVPETPRWFLLHEKPLHARQSLLWLRRDPKTAEEEFKMLTYPITDDQATGVGIKEFFKPQLYRPLIISVGLMCTQQLSGINAVMFNSKSIFSTSFSNPNTASLAANGVALMQVIFTFVACLFCDRCGRRFLLLFSGTVMFFSCITMGIYYFLTDNQGHSAESLGWLAAASLMIYVAAFSLGWGPVPWLVMSEIFPNNARSAAASIATALNWLSSFIITKEFSDLEHLLHRYGAFWLFAGILFVGLTFTAIMLPETKGRTLDEIQENFAPKENRGMERNLSSL